LRSTVFAAFLALTCSALAFVPTPEQYETKWLLPGLDHPTGYADSTHDYDVRFYRIDLDLPMTDRSMTAHAGIWLTSEVASLDSVVFDFSRLECDSVKRDGRPQDFDTYSTFLAVYLDSSVALGDSVYLDIYYHRLSTSLNLGFYYYLEGSGRGRNHSVCYTITEPEDSRYWFPCWDKPWDKAEQGCQVNITVPDSFRACANGMLDSISGGGYGKKTYWWTHRYPIPTYLINYGASIYKEITQWYHYSPTDSMLIRHWVWPEDSVQAATAFANVPDMVAFYSDSTRFGQYPFLAEKYGQVAVYPFGAGGMEHQTMTTIHRAWITNADESGIAHELGHMWYGDNVTCFIWPEIWINEGGASYLDPLWHYHHYGRSTFLSAMEDYRQGFFSADNRDRHPIYDPGMQRLFDYGHTYCKAAWVNHMTRYVEGDTSFENPGIWWQTERAFLDSFAYGTATTEDRRRIHQQVAGVDLGWFYDEWVYMAGFPNYAVNWYPREATDGWEIVVDVGQNNGSQAPACFHMPVEALVDLAGGGDTLLHWDISSNPQRNVFPLSSEPTDLEFNPGQWILEKHEITSGIENEILPSTGVSRATLHPVSPNPVLNNARIQFSLPHTGNAYVAVHDAAGRLVRTLWSGQAGPGHTTVTWDRADDKGRNLAAGVYLIRMKAEGVTQTRKLILH